MTRKQLYKSIKQVRLEIHFIRYISILPVFIKSGGSGEGHHTLEIRFLILHILIRIGRTKYFNYE